MKLTMRATATLGKKVTLITAAFVLAVSTLTAAVPFILSEKASAVASLAYQGIPSSPAANYPSVGHQAYATNELGDRVQLAGSNRLLKEVEVNFSTWACESGAWNTNNCVSTPGATFNLPVKVNVYAVNGDGTVGAKIAEASKTLNAKYRPSADAACTGADVGKWSDGSACYNGLAYTESFDLSASNTVLPNEVIVGIAYNTSSFGYNPTGTSGPADAFNISLQTAAPATGTDVDAGTMYRSTPSSTLATYAGYAGYHLGFNIVADSTPTVEACSATTTVWSKDLSAWDLTSTKSAGHNVVTGDGLRVYTDNNSSDAKAAAYLAVNYPLAANGAQTIAESMDWTGGQQPGLQLVVDFDNNGTPDGILVGEATYGNDWWLSNSSAQFVKDNAPNNGGGYGSAWYGELNEWLSKFPTAQVKAVGYSLGSGVESDGIIKRLSYGCVDYKFDNAAPLAPTHTSPSNNAVQSSNNFLFDWTDVSDAVRYEIQNSQSASLDPATGSFQNVQWTGDYLQVQPSVSQAQSVGASGTWYWQVRAIDAAGNASAWTAPWKVTIDAQAPTAPQLNTPTNNQVFTSNSIPASWTAATDANGISKYEVEYIYDDGHTFAGGPYREVSGATTSRTHNPGTNEQGGVTIRVRAYDTAGNVGAWSNAVHYFYDNTKPTVAVDSAVVSNADKTLDVSVTANDASSGVKRIEFNLYDSTNTTKVATLKGENYTDFAKVKTLTLTGFDISGLASGTYVIRAAALDNAGLLSNYATQAIVLDNTAPQVVSIAYEPGTLTNGNVIATITFDEAVALISSGWTATDSTNTVFTKTYIANTTGDVVDFSDAAGNPGQANVVINWIDKTAPVISSPITNGATVRGTAIFSIDEATKLVTVNGTAITSSGTAGKGPYQVTGDGTYTVVATDLAGNVSDAFTFTINNAQTITLNPIDLQSATPLITGTALWVVDPAAVDSMTVTIDGNPYAAAIDADGNWSVQVISPLENGAHTLVVNGTSFAFTTSIPAALLAPAITSPAGALGASDEADAANNGEQVEGASSENKAAQAAADANKGVAMGLAWYWWLLILAGIALILWWIIAAIRRRQSQDA